MAKVRNILFIMYDQLRYDYLSCAGHPHLKTPHFDRVASHGVRFSRCYVQSPVCGASRMSFYTGRYVHSHGAAWNNYPLKVGELTMGDHLRDCGMDAWLVGKTHMKVDAKGLARLGISAESVIGARVAECGFDIHLRDDGLWGVGPDGSYDSRPSPYNTYLKGKQYPGDNPWQDYANAGVEDDMEIASGWLLKHTDKPANIREEDSETPWLTRCGIEFIEKQNPDKPWLCHLSFIKPHWPYIVPKPYHDMYNESHLLPVVRNESEKQDAHPVYQSYFQNAIAKAICAPGIREKVIPAYMGLVKQCDDQLGVLLDYLETSGRMQDTMIVLTSDHGDYLGDHWLGEKDLFHECSVKVPLIIYDPSDSANATRGSVCDELVESIDLTATFIETAGGAVPDHIVEGKSLIPFLHNHTPVQWRDYAVSEYDYSATPQAMKLNLEPRDARLFMVADKRWKFMHADGGFRPMLFDLENDPDELNDLGDSDEHEDILSLMYERLSQWARRPSQRTTTSDETIHNMRGDSRRKGILLGTVDGRELEKDVLDSITGKATMRFTDPE